MPKKVVCDGKSCKLVDVSSDEEKDESLPEPVKTLKWLIYGADWCGFCVKAKELLKKKGLKFTFINVDNFKDSRKLLKKWTKGYKTIPVIYKEGKFIGGFTDLQKLV